MATVNAPDGVTYVALRGKTARSASVFNCHNDQGILSTGPRVSTNKPPTQRKARLLRFHARTYQPDCGADLDRL
jgi:hypothetical protein